MKTFLIVGLVLVGVPFFAVKGETEGERYVRILEKAESEYNTQAWVFGGLAAISAVTTGIVVAKNSNCRRNNFGGGENWECFGEAIAKLAALAIGIPATGMSLGTVFYKIHRSNQFAQFAKDARDGKTSNSELRVRVSALGESVRTGRYIASGLSFGATAVIAGIAGGAGGGNALGAAMILSAPFTIAGIYNLFPSSAEDAADNLEREMSRPRVGIDFYPIAHNEFYSGVRLTF